MGTFSNSMTLHYKLYTKHLVGDNWVCQTQIFYKIEDAYAYVKRINPDKWLLNELVYDTFFIGSHNWEWDD